MNGNGNNPYLRAGHYPPSGSGGGWTRAPGGYFGHGRQPGWGRNYHMFGASSGVYTPAATSYFGAVCPPPAADGRPCPPPGMMQPCPPPGMMHPAMQQQQTMVDEGRLRDLMAVLRHPQWPNMPQLTPIAEQAAAAMTVAGSQRHADNLTIIYGVDSGDLPLIPNGATANVTVTPQKRHIPEKLVLSEAIAAGFLITGIFAGVEPVLATTGPISAAIFVQDSTSPAFKSVIMDVGMDFTVGVTNISGADARFTTTVVGKPVPPGL